MDHQHFRTPTFLPILGAVFCAFLTGPWTGRAVVQYQVAGVLLAIGVGLWFVTVMFNRATGVKPVEPDVETYGRGGPQN